MTDWSTLTTDVLCQDDGDLVEDCQLELLSFHYQLPRLGEEVLQLISLDYPEPQEVCVQVETAQLETECQQQEEEEICLTSAHLRSSRTGLEAEQVELVRSGPCQERELSLQQTRCELEQRVEARPYYGNQHAAFTVFQ